MADAAPCADDISKVDLPPSVIKAHGELIRKCLAAGADLSSIRSIPANQVRSRDFKKLLRDKEGAPPVPLTVRVKGAVLETRKPPAGTTVRRQPLRRSTARRAGARAASSAGKRVHRPTQCHSMRFRPVRLHTAEQFHFDHFLRNLGSTWANFCQLKPTWA